MLDVAKSKRVRSQEIIDQMSSGLFYNAHNLSGMRAKEPLVIGGKQLPITNEEGYFAWRLMRGGFEDELTIAMMINVKFSIIKRVDLQAIFLFFDNDQRSIKTPPRKLPNVALRCNLSCRRCGVRLYEVPCGCSNIECYTTAQPKDYEPEIGTHMWVDKSDRNWANTERIAESERAYHGGYYE